MECVWNGMEVLAETWIQEEQHSKLQDYHDWFEKEIKGKTSIRILKHFTKIKE